MKIFPLPLALRLLRRLPIPRKLGLLEKLFGKSLNKAGQQWVQCWNGVVWKLDLCDPCHRWIVYGYYEGGEGINFARRQLAKGGRYLDSGANIGQWMLYIAGQQGIETIAVEPVASEHAWLRECLECQQDWNVQLHKAGLGSQAGEAQIRAYGARSTLQLDWYMDQNNLPLETIQIRRLDELLEAQGIERIDFWKLDVEGGELEALKGADTLLKQQKIENIYLECHPDSFPQTRALLMKFDYRLSELVGQNLRVFEADSIDQTTDLIAQPIQPRD